MIANKYPVTEFWAMPDAIPTNRWFVVGVRNGKADWKKGIVAIYDADGYDAACADAEARNKVLAVISF